MADSTFSSTQTARLADRIAAAQRQHFVGRKSELELFRSALLDTEPPFVVLHLYGPGGIGKTTLLHEFVHIAQSLSIPAIRLDGRNLNPSPSEFLLALGLALGLDGGASPLEMLAQHSRSVLLLDTYETLTPLDDWLRDTFLPQLPEGCLVVIAGRNAPTSSWRTAPGWRDLVRIVSLRNLSPDDSVQYLNTRGLPEAQHPSVLAFTHGHPLALALVADVVTQSDTPFNPEDEPDVVRVLLEQFVQHVPSPRHREALEICAHTRVTTEDSLAAILGNKDAHELFEWLSSLSFIERDREGVFPHDLARDVLDANLRWRNPAAYRDLHYRVRGYILERLYNTKGVEQQSSFLDLLYLHRNNPLMKPYIEWKALGQAHVEPATTNDFPQILEMVRQHEGEESAQIANYWLQRQPQTFLGFRSLTGELIGFMANLQLELMTSKDIEADPAIQAAMDFIQRHGGIRPGEEMTYLRFWMGRDTYQEISSVLNLACLASALHWLTHPQLARSFLTFYDVEYWRAFMNYYQHWHSPETDFEVGGRRYGVFTHDWRAEPAEVYLQILGERELETDLKPEMLETPTASPLIVLSQPEFEDAVRAALHDYTDPDLLATNPLLRSRVVVESAGMEAAPHALQAILREAANSLKTNPKNLKLFHALHHTYFEPAPTQEAAAELLDLPFSTYRYHLTNGVKRVTEWLWQRELYGFKE